MYRLGANEGWHERHWATPWYTARPRSTAAAWFCQGSGVGTIGSPGSSSFHRGEKVFTYWMMATRFFSGTPSQARTAVPCRPKRTTPTLSSSFGSVPPVTATYLTYPTDTPPPHTLLPYTVTSLPPHCPTH